MLTSNSNRMYKKADNKFDMYWRYLFIAVLILKSDWQANPIF